jgi:hypothetical protein
MGGNGSSIAYKKSKSEQEKRPFVVVGNILDAEVISGTSGNSGVPLEGEVNGIYIKLKKDGEIKDILLYDENGEVYMQLSYHAEANINNGDSKKPIWHGHIWKNGERVKKSIFPLKDRPDLFAVAFKYATRKYPEFIILDTRKRKVLKNGNIYISRRKP